MLVNTKGIVVKTINYGETSVIATIYTEQLGLRTYMLKGVRSGRSKRKGNIYQLMQFLDMIVNWGHSPMTFKNKKNSDWEILFAENDLEVLHKKNKKILFFFNQTIYHLKKLEV